jgi:hypothetical protein
MRTTAQADVPQLVSYNQLLLDQALAVVVAHTRLLAPPYAGLVGAHLRHVIEHHEALMHGLALGVVDYDGRPRDRELEVSQRVAGQRLLRLRESLSRLTHDALHRPMQVLGQGGIAGDFHFSVASCVGRELVFLASHTVHHFALLSAHLHKQGIALPAHFGKAPGTVANEIAVRRATEPSLTLESLCPSPSLAA